jgi:hypothetical protein
MTDDLSTWKLTELAARFAELEGRECHDVAANYWDELERRQAIADATAEQGECYYQLEIRGKIGGWEVVSASTDHDIPLDDPGKWFETAKVFHTYHDMRLVKVTKRVLFFREASDG